MSVQPGGRIIVGLGIVNRGNGSGGTPRKVGWGCAAHFPKPLLLTLFMTKICDFCYPIYDLAKKFDTLVMTVAADS